jgi:pyruvate kinase
LRRTKIICTIGPSSDSPEMLEKLILGGMDIARINTSHSLKDDAEKRIDSIRKISRKHKKNTAIMLDLQGPKIRVGRLEKSVLLSEKQRVVLTSVEDTSKLKEKYRDIEIISVDYAEFIKDLEPGCSVFIDDGLLEIKVLEVDAQKNIAEGRVVIGGVLGSRKGINLPGISVSLDSVTEKDIRFLNFGIKLGVDFIAQSFVRDSEDIKKIKDIIKSNGSNIMVIAKIEKHEAVSNFDSILECSDGIMVARGDLGIEMPEEDVPNIQKEIIRKSNVIGKPVITATQMLDSMMRNPRPTRAEVSDVANAIYDGSDTVMLSGETAAGIFPLKALRMMVRIINKTEKTLNYQEILSNKFSIKQNTITEAISFAACEIASVLDAKAIITATQSGGTARQISKNRPGSIIIGASPNDWVVRQLMLSWGVIPAGTKFRKNINQTIEEAIGASKELGYVSAGDKVIVTGGVVVNKSGSTNFLNVREVE